MLKFFTNNDKTEIVIHFFTHAKIFNKNINSSQPILESATQGHSEFVCQTPHECKQVLECLVDSIQQELQSRLYGNSEKWLKIEIKVAGRIKGEAVNKTFNDIEDYTNFLKEFNLLPGAKKLTQFSEPPANPFWNCLIL